MPHKEIAEEKSHMSRSKETLDHKSACILRQGTKLLPTATECRDLSPHSHINIAKARDQRAEKKLVHISGPIYQRVKQPTVHGNCKDYWRERSSNGMPVL